MAIKIVTDSSADLPPEIVEELGITVVPLYVRFGEKVYRERVDISVEEFYNKLTTESVHPATVQPAPQDFAQAYRKVAEEADGIVSIHISNKLSGTYNAALQGKQMTKSKLPIEVIDSMSVTMGLGLIVMTAARAAKAGGTLQQVVDETKLAMPKARLLGLLDTLRYLLIGGRIGKAKALVGSLLNVKPMVTLKDGEVMPAGQTRTRNKGIERLVDFVKGASKLEQVVVLYNTSLEEAKSLGERLNPTFPREKIIYAKLGTTLGTHLGPNFLGIATLEGKGAG